MKAALLVIDMQNMFVEEGGYLFVKSIEKGLVKYREFIDYCRSNSVEVIFTRHNFDPNKNKVEAKFFLDERMKVLRAGEHAWEICNELRPLPGELVIDKSRYDAFFGTDLHEELQRRGLDTVIITGTMTNICCESTARTAMYYDYNVIFCEDLTFCSDASAHEGTLRVMNSHFGIVKSAAEIMKMIGE